jgi:hypothetical protein
VAVAVVMEFKGGTLEDYDKVLDALGYTPGGPGESGGLFHWVTKTDDGIRVTDVWQDRATFDRFSEEKIGPGMQAAGVDLTPEIEFFEVHNYQTAG